MGRRLIFTGALYLGMYMTVFAAHATATTSDFDKEIKDGVTSMESIVDPVYNSMVSNYIRWYADGPREYMSALIERSELYFPYIEAKLHEEGLPEDLKYMVVIESELRPAIKSRVGAGGLWQLMIPTAKYFGLRVNRYVDERLDPYRSTDAAIIYLKELHNQFGDWSLAMAAYNAGPGRVRKAMRLSGSDDYWKMQAHLPVETQKYLPKFIAAQYFFTKGDWSKFEPRPVPYDLMVTTEVRITRPVNLKKVAKALNVEHGLLRILNPSWQQHRIGSEEAYYSLRIPTRVVQDWLAWEYDYTHGPIEEQEAEANELLYTNSPDYLNFNYRVQEGESLSEIAHSLGIKEYLIRYWNNLGAEEKVRRGQVLELILPSTHDCAYIARILSQNRKTPKLDFPPLPTIKSSEDQPKVPENLAPVELISRTNDQQRKKPIILPRGMTASEYSFYAQE